MSDDDIDSSTDRQPQAIAGGPGPTREGGASTPARRAGRVQGGAVAGAPRGRARMRRPVTVRAPADAAGRGTRMPAHPAGSAR